jgi:nucleotide-binding universal stress UspA family protein
VTRFPEESRDIPRTGHFSLDVVFHNEMPELLDFGRFLRFQRFSEGLVLALVSSARHSRRDHWRFELKRLSRVLVAVAIDDRERHVFAHALALARRHDATLLLLHATSPDVSFNRGATERVEFLRQLRSLAEAADVEIRVAVQTGPVHEIILLHARAREVDLIVMGTTPNERRRGLSGWIAERVLRDAPCPTLVVPQTAAVPGSPGQAVLCAVDLSPASQAAVREAVRLSAGGNRPVTLLHVVNASRSSLHVHSAGLATHEFHHGLGAYALSKLQSLIPQEHKGAIIARVAVGRPVTQILRAARSMQAQVIVIGAARRTRIGSKLFGTTGQLLRDAKCPILAVPASHPAKQDAEHLHREAA